MDIYQYNLINNNKEYLVNCIKDKYKPNSLLYYLSHNRSLKSFLEENILDCETFRKLISQIINELITLISNGVRIINLIMNLDYIFLDEANNCVHFIYVPINTSMNLMQDSYSSLAIPQYLLREIINYAQTVNCEELIGTIMTSINSRDFNIFDFEKSLFKLNGMDVNTALENKYIRNEIILYIGNIIQLIASILLVILKISAKFYIEHGYEVLFWVFTFFILIANAISLTLLVTFRKRKKEKLLVKIAYTEITIVQ